VARARIEVTLKVNSTIHAHGMGLQPHVAILACSLLLKSGVCSAGQEPQGCDASPDTCKRETDVVSNLQANIHVANEGAGAGKAGADDAFKRDSEDENDFLKYVSEFGRTYMPGSAEYVERLTLFRQRKAEVDEQNSKAGRLWTAGINDLSDLRHTELQQLLGRIRPRKNYADASKSISLRQDTNSSQAMDTECTKWNDLRAVQQIKSQGGCGSCWAFAAATVLEAHAEIAEKPRTFSTQELVDCVENPHNCGGSGGCSGATVELALDYVTKNALATSEADPYHAHGEWCSKPNRKREPSIEVLNTPKVHTAMLSDPSRTFGMVGWERLPENKYEPLLHAVSQRGPVAISVAASRWFAYKFGIFNRCWSVVINHAVVLVGYGQEMGTKYWLVQNSWGYRWGEAGKIRILRKDNDENDCDTDYQPEVGTGCDGGPSSVRVCGPCGILYDSALPHFKK